ncbi:hypothetical protein KIW84_044959 [Lathyrus oleraceus]|uniref:Thaumatin-like protein n=1 Tax=Pisum sativum TaxID=3888 RepID=A0A9D5AW31_PEA|nr:hypothetical protein KIW84_044959 [Pisum sativum]
MDFTSASFAHNQKATPDAIKGGVESLGKGEDFRYRYPARNPANSCSRQTHFFLVLELYIYIDGGVKLKPGQTINVTAPKGWSGRFWGRHGCTFNNFSIGKCITGDCGGKLRCAGAGGEPPASLAEFTLDSQVEYFYDVSLVDGYNMPVSIIPLGGSGMRKAVKCRSDLNRNSAGLEMRNIKGRALLVVRVLVWLFTGRNSVVLVFSIVRKCRLHVL